MPEELARTSVYRIEIKSWSGKKKAVEADFPGAFLYGTAEVKRTRRNESTAFNFYDVETGAVSVTRMKSQRKMMQLEAIATIHSPVSEGVDEDWGAVVSEIQLKPELAAGLRGLDGFSHALIVFFMHQSSFNAASDLVRRARGRADMPEAGIFAQRAKHRPNPIGITAVEIVSIEGNVLRVRGLDAIDGTPVLDIKPYVPVFDRRDDGDDPGMDGSADAGLLLTRKIPIERTALLRYKCTQRTRAQHAVPLQKHPANVWGWTEADCVERCKGKLMNARPVPAARNFSPELKPRSRWWSARSPSR